MIYRLAVSQCVVKQDVLSSITLLKFKKYTRDNVEQKLSANELKENNEALNEENLKLKAAIKQSQDELQSKQVNTFTFVFNLR